MICELFVEWWIHLVFQARRLNLVVWSGYFESLKCSFLLLWYLLLRAIFSSFGFVPMLFYHELFSVYPEQLNHFGWGIKSRIKGQMWWMECILVMVEQWMVVLRPVWAFKYGIYNFYSAISDVVILSSWIGHDLYKIFHVRRWFKVTCYKLMWWIVNPFIFNHSIESLHDFISTPYHNQKCSQSKFALDSLK